MVVWPEYNSRPPARQPHSQPTEPPVRGKHETIFLLRSEDRRGPQQASYLCRCQSQQLQRSFCETSDIIAVPDVIHDLAPATRMAFNTLQRAVNVRALCAKTLCKWIVRILTTLVMMISETNDTASNNCYMNLNFL